MPIASVLAIFAALGVGPAAAAVGTPPAVAGAPAIAGAPANPAAPPVADAPPAIVGARAFPTAEVCTVDDARATEISGLVATPTGFIAINDSQLDSAAMRIIHLNARCKVTKTVSYPTPARDPEDLAVAPDGTLWVGDIGDNATSEVHRTTVALWRVPADGAPVVHRLAYPDGPHDAEALLFNSDGTPVIVTKEPSGRAGLYRPTAPLRENSQAGVSMERVGEFVPRVSGENNPFGPMGEMVVTGAAVSPDRLRVVLRTYSAAYEWDVAQGGDVVKAITTTTPRVTSLPDERQGESIAYTSDGTEFLTIDDQQGPALVRRYARSMTTLPPLASGTPAPREAAPPWGIKAIPAWAGLTAAASGLVLAIVGFLGLRRSRNRETPPPAV